MSRVSKVVGGVAALGLCGLWACTEVEMPQADEGETVFLNNCAACHGVRGEGGLLVGGQTAPDLTRIAARRDGEFPRAEILSRIDGYGQGHGPDAVMPEFGPLLTGSPVPLEVDGTLTPTPRALAALVTYLEQAQTSEL